MILSGKCCYPLLNIKEEKTERCNRKTINKLHCSLHHREANKLYIKYKKISRRTDEINWLSDEITYYIKIHGLLTKEYNFRTEYQKKYIIESCRDQGHEHKLQKLSKSMERCERRINRLHQKQLKCSVVEMEISESEESSEDFVDITTSKELVNPEEFQKENEEYLNKCLEENKIHQERTHKIWKIIASCVCKLYVNTEPIAENRQIFLAMLTYQFYLLFVRINPLIPSLQKIKSSISLISFKISPSTKFNRSTDLKEVGNFMGEKKSEEYLNSLLTNYNSFKIIAKDFERIAAIHVTEIYGKALIVYWDSKSKNLRLADDSIIF